MNTGNGVYDDDQAKKPIPKSDLKELENGHKKTGVSERLIDPTSGGKGSVSSSVKDIAKAEAGIDSTEDKLGAGYTGNEDESNKDPGKNIPFYKKRRNQGIFGGGLVGLVLVGLIALFSMLIPLKIESIVSNLENRFFATSDDAVQNETDNLFSKYVTSRVLPGYKSCGSTIDKECSASSFGTNPVAQLFDTWKQAKIENTLAEKYGIEFEHTPGSNTWRIKAPGLASDGVDLGTGGEKLDQEFNSRGAFRTALKSSLDTALEEETSWKSVMTRYKVGRLMEEKYGVKRCLIFCGVTDPLHDKVADQKIAAKLFLVQRVIQPRDESLGIALECLFSNCSADNQPNSDPGAPAEDGAAGDPQIDTEVSSGLRNLAATYDITDEASLKAIQDAYNQMSEDGLQKYLITKALTPIIGDAAAGTTADAVPIAGWMNLAAQIVNTSNNSSGLLTKLRYAVNASAAVSLYMMYRTYADEIHTGNVTATEVGSMTDSLGSGGSSTPSNPELGGTASAEETPLYQDLMNDGSSSSSVSKTASLVGDLFSGTAYADSSSTTSSDKYLCNNGKPVPSGQVICSEESLSGGSSLANSIHDFPGMSILGTIATGWEDSVGQIFNGLGGILGSAFNLLTLPFNESCKVLIVQDNPYCLAKNAAESGISTVATGVTSYLIPNPFSNNMSGGRTFDMMAAGSDVAGNDYAHNGLGGEALTPTQTADIVNQQNSEAKSQLANKPIFARLFSTSSPYSLVSKLALDMPTSLQSASQSFIATLASNPFASLFHYLGSAFSMNASAATPAQADPFGIVQYGYPSGTIPTDPEKYWDQNCSTDASQGYQKLSPGETSWNQEAASTPDPGTGMPENTSQNGGTNACELIMASVGSAGGIFNTSLLTSDDLADTNGTTSTSTSGSSTGGGTTTAGFTNPFPGGWTPNRLDMGYDGTFKGQIVAPFSGTITYAASSFSNWGGYIELKADQQPNGLPTSTLYFAEGVAPAQGISNGSHVSAGQAIGVPAPSPYGDAYGTTSDGSGQIEWGVAVDGSSGTPTNPLAESGVTNPAQMVLNFASWVEQTLSVAPPASTNSAGYAS